MNKVLVLFGATAVTVTAAPAHAQFDVNPPLPNVMLLVDTSGSMENMIDGRTPEITGAGSACNPGVATAPNRWATVLDVLTGTIRNFSCQSVDRTLASFGSSEYAFQNVASYDWKYYLPYHRPLSTGKCGPAPGAAPVNWWDWPNGAIGYHDDQNVLNVCTTWEQASDGLLDVFRDRVRFGLMTFDTLPDPGIGTAGNAPDSASGNLGMWSYYQNWISGSGWATGNPVNCASKPFEVGARNAAAPPWEGRLVPFGPFNASTAQNRQTNQRIQDALNAVRPYGATPLAGMMDDAKYYFLNDLQNDPNWSAPYGPSTDPYWIGGCRKAFIIILSDGEPNLDLKPDCTMVSGGPPNINGVCPYLDPWVTANTLYNNAPLPVTTFVVGFGLSMAKDTAGNTFDCSTITSNHVTDLAPFADGKLCSAQTGALKACCTLGRVAYEGSGGLQGPYFANSAVQLKQKLSQILASVAAGSTSRTVPTFATASVQGGAAQGSAPATSYQFLSSFGMLGPLWTGNLERERFTCDAALNPTIQPVTAGLGDDFAANLNSEAGFPRKFLTAVGQVGDGGKIYSTHSIRPYLTADDGMGLYSGAVPGGGLLDRATFANSVGFAAMGVTSPTVQPDCVALFNDTVPASCARDILLWELGDAAVQYSRAPLSPNCNPGPCSEFGSVYHSTPIIVGPPQDFLRDESYSAFAVAQKSRPTMLYTGTTDGQLHAFKVAANNIADLNKVDSLTNNELWSFLPPAVLPGLIGTVNQQAFLLDGQAVTKDVVFDRTPTSALAGAGVGAAAWSTVLVAGGGAAGSKYYFALDVTDPTTPRFLWQISTGGKELNGNLTDDNDTRNQLIGDIPPTPAIASINLADSSGVVHEVAVAILPGGAGILAGGVCARNPAGSPLDWSYATPITAGYSLRPNVRCWTPDNDQGGVSTRSLTIVRLDTGQVLMNFRGYNNDGPPTLTAGVTWLQAPFSAPVSGVPVPYPADIGQVSNRVYIGDADGMLYRVDLSDPAPSNWTVKPAWDAFSMPGDLANSGQPIEIAPVVSVDPVGNPVILFATGDQQNLNTSVEDNRVWSIIEKPVAGHFVTTENWVIPFNFGKRVAGNLALFDGTVHFATYTPVKDPNLALCTDGFGSIWGVDYLQAVAQPLGPYPVARTLITGLLPAGASWCLDDGTGHTWCQDQAPGITVGGVGIAETPTCFSTTTTTDAYFGGSFTTVNAANTGNYQLVYTTGRGGTAQNGSVTNTETQALPRPRESTRIDSWSAIIE